MQLQEKADLLLKPDFARKTIVFARQKAEKRSQFRIMVITAIFCCVGIMSYHWLKSSIVQNANLKNWNYHQTLLAQVESAY
jgi:hypothetical protein